MSGSCGIVTFDGAPVPVDAVERMCASARHRGPDGTSIWRGAGAVLAHQLLALVPGEIERAQPLAAHDRVVVADARLDNRDDLVPLLERAGLLDRGSGPPSDAEVVLAAHRRWGEGCAERLVGDFAFVVWDEVGRTLLAARDPMGMRLLAYRVEPGQRFVFGTEVAQVLAAPGVPKRVFEPAIAADMAAHFGRPEWSFYEGVAQLAPGHILVCDARGHRVRRFWDVDPALQVSHADLSGYAEHLRATFCEAVAARLRTTRPVGVLLSGGMDSGSAASVAGWLLEQGAVPSNDVLAAQWAFDQLPHCDERVVSRLITGHYGFRDVDVPADDAGPLACYPAHVPPVDDPMVGGFQPVIEHGLEALAELGAGVVLGGDRGDLVIGDAGASYLGMAAGRQWTRLRDELRVHRAVHGEPFPSIVHQHLVRVLVRRACRRSPIGWARWARAKARGPAGNLGVAMALPPWMPQALAERTDLAEILSAPHHSPDGLSTGAATRYRLIFNQLHVRGMAWSERTYARKGLCFADPFSDRRLVSLVVAMPGTVMNRPGDQSKPLLREAMRGIMPEAARRQADKVFPSDLFDRSLRVHAPLVDALLGSSALVERGWADGAALRHHFNGWLRGQPLHAAFWWTLGVELWLREHEQ